MIREDLKEYIGENIFPIYERNDEGHRIDHINYVIDRSIRFASTIPNIDYDMVYTIASYHDVGVHIDRKRHEIISADILYHDHLLRKFFEEDNMIIMKEAVEDHRASLEYVPRSIYGKIVSSADRNTDVDTIIKRTFAYRKKIMNEVSIGKIIEESRLHIIDKFGKNGYAKDKMYFPDYEYENYLKELEILTSDKELFTKRYKLVNNI